MQSRSLNSKILFWRDTIKRACYPIAGNLATCHQFTKEESKVTHQIIGRSCVTQLLKIMDIWTRILDESASNGIDVAYLDYKNAFDTVLHERLLTKLQGYGIRGVVLKWIRKFGRK